MGFQQLSFSIVLLVICNEAGSSPRTTAEPIISSTNFVTNVTLENKFEMNTGWKIPRDTIPKWFEYYNSTTHFHSETQNRDRCASTQDFESLKEKEGIWVACLDPELPSDCFSVTNSQCHPVLTYDTGCSHFETLRTIKISFALYGLATLRLKIGHRKCLDLSYREDPFSPCEFYDITPAMVSDGWIQTQFRIESYESVAFNSFSLELIARFAYDVVLLDKVEATEYLLCGPDTTCPTKTTTTTARTFPSFPTTTTFTTLLPENRTSLLDISDEGYWGWSVPCVSEIPRWLEYYRYTIDFLYGFNISDSCSNAFYQELLPVSLTFAAGIWVACKDPELQVDECSISTRAPCHPFIRFRNGLDPNEAVGSIQITYFMHGQATIRLILNGNKCIEYSTRKDLDSTCQFIEAPSSPENKWMELNYELEQNYFVREFQIDMIAKDDHDFVLIDKVEATIYEVCEYSPSGCSEFTTTVAFTSTTVVKTSAETMTTGSPSVTVPSSEIPATTASSASYSSYIFLHYALILTYFSMILFFNEP